MGFWDRFFNTKPSINPPKQHQKQPWMQELDKAEEETHRREEQLKQQRQQQEVEDSIKAHLRAAAEKEELKARFACYICGQKPSVAKMVFHENTNHGGQSDFVSNQYWEEVHTGIGKCRRCSRYACDELHYYKGFCQRCAEKKHR